MKINEINKNDNHIKISIRHIEVPYMKNGETIMLDGVLVRDIPSGVKSYFYPIKMTYINPANIICDIVNQKNKEFNTFFKNLYLEKKSVIVYNKKGKSYIIDWVDYQKSFENCSFYFSPEKIEKAKIINL